MLKIDESGYPRLELGTIISPVKSGTGRGNSAHDSFTGRFTFLPPGINILEGKEHAQELSSATARLFRDRAKAVGANQAVMRIINGKLHFVLLKDGKKLDSFAVESVEKRKGKDDPVQAPTEARLTDEERFAIIKMARDLGLSGEKLQKRIADTFEGIAPDQIQQIAHEVDLQRLLDLVMYLDQRGRIELKNEKISDNEIRIGVGRGFIRRSFSTVSPDQLRIIQQRLQGLGWTPEETNKILIGKVPKRLKDELKSENKSAEGERMGTGVSR